MTRFALLFLLSGFAFAQAGDAPPPRAPETAQPAPPAAVNLNDSDNARQARTVLDRTVQALGGQAYLTYENKEESGRYYPFYHGRTGSTGIPYNYYVEYPSRDRFEIVHTKDIHVIPGSIDIGGVKVAGKFDLVQIFNGNKGFELTYKGTAALEPEDVQNHLRRRQHSLEAVFRRWVGDPKVALFYEGQAVVDGKQTEGVSLLNSQNDSVSVYLDINTHYPVKISYSWRDPKDKQKNEEYEIYDNYKLVQGIWTAHAISRYFNGDTSQQRFITTASYNQKLSDSMFDASVTYDPKAPLKKR